MKIHRQRRPARAGRRLNLPAFREALEDGKLHCSLAKVVDVGGSHFEIDEQEGVLVEVQLLPSRTPVTARLASVAGGPGNGVWRVPAVGTEVVVVIPHGDLGATPVIVGTLSSQSVPEGIAPERTVIVAPEVLIYDTASNEAEPLVKKSEYDALKAAYDAHIHATTATIGAGSTPGVLTPTVSLAPAATGTTVLKAK